MKLQVMHHGTQPVFCRHGAIRTAGIVSENIFNNSFTFKNSTTAKSSGTAERTERAFHPAKTERRH